MSDRAPRRRAGRPTPRNRTGSPNGSSSAPTSVPNRGSVIVDARERPPTGSAPRRRRREAARHTSVLPRAAPRRRLDVTPTGVVLIEEPGRSLRPDRHRSLGRGAGRRHRTPRPGDREGRRRRPAGQPAARGLAATAPGRRRDARRRARRRGLRRAPERDPAASSTWSRASSTSLAPLSADADRRRRPSAGPSRARRPRPARPAPRGPRGRRGHGQRGCEVWVDRSGDLTRLADLHPGSIDVVLERVLAPLGKRLDRTSPIVDARLPDGARLCAVVEPVALDGTTMSIRRHRRRRVPIGDFADTAVVERAPATSSRPANVLVTGATSSGKTTLLAALTDSIRPASGSC